MHSVVTCTKYDNVDTKMIHDVKEFMIYNDNDYVHKENIIYKNKGHRTQSQLH